MEFKTYCDKCGKELVGTENYENIHIDIHDYYDNVDLCASCFEKLIGLVRNFFDKKSEDTE